MKIYRIEILSKKDFVKLANIAKTLYFYDIALVVTNTKNLETKSLEKYLSKEEKEKAKSYISKVARLNYVISRAIINFAFRDMLKTDIENLNFQRDKNNKPFIGNNENIKFNISHTNGCVVVGFSKQEIGVDIEKVNREFKFQDILNDCFTEKEINKIKDEHINFFKYWTAKEAYLKHKGSGLLRNPKEIEIVYTDEKLIEIKDKNTEETKLLKPIEPYRDYIGAICI